MGSGATKAPDRRTPAPGTARSRALITGGHIPPILVSRAHLETRLRQRRHKPPRPDPRLAPCSCFVVKPLNGLQVRSILDHDEELEALLSRVAASRRLVIDVDPAEKTRRDGQALVAVTIALTTNLRAAPGKGSRSRPDCDAPGCGSRDVSPPSTAVGVRGPPRAPSAPVVESLSEVAGLEALSGTNHPK